MENSIYLGLSRQMALQNNMDTIANNVANVNTPGFRGQNLLFHEFISDPAGSKLDPLSFVYDDGQYEVTAPGPVKTTGNPLDIALDGPGFIGVVAPSGKVAYTRAGNFQLGAGGILETSAGYPVSSTGGSSITIPADSTEINIDEKGGIHNQNGQVGQIKIAEFGDVKTLQALGHNLYLPSAPEQPATKTRVKQGVLEGSNVEPVIEMTRMIDTLRSFQNVQNVLQSENDRLRSAIRQLTNQG